MQAGQRRNINFYLKINKMDEGEKSLHMMKDSASAPPEQPHKMEPAPASQHHMVEMPPPSYSEAVPGPAPLPGPKGGLPGVELGTEPVQLSCYHCHRQVTLQ